MATLAFPLANQSYDDSDSMQGLIGKACIHLVTPDNSWCIKPYPQTIWLYFPRCSRSPITLAPTGMPSRPNAHGSAVVGFSGAWQRQAPLDLLSGILPTATTSAFLRACLAPPPLAREAWQRWRSRWVPAMGLVGADGDLRGLSALLANSILTAGAVLDHSDETWLRVALLHEQRRSRRYRQILAEVLATLTRAGVPFLLARGAALAETVLPEPWLRHCHDIDLLVAEEHLAAADEALTPLGLRQQPLPGPSRSYLHPRLLPIRLHPCMLQPPFQGLGIGVMSERASSARVLGTMVRRPVADDLLLHICAHAVCSRSRLSPRWVCDAHAIIVGPERPDWSRLRQTAAATSLSASLAVTLGYLAGAIGSPLPSGLLAGLASDAAGASRLDRDLLIHAAQFGGDRWLIHLYRNTNSRSRLTLLRWMLAPERAYIERLEAGRGFSWFRLRARHWRRVFFALTASFTGISDRSAAGEPWNGWPDRRSTPGLWRSSSHFEREPKAVHGHDQWPGRM